MSQNQLQSGEAPAAEDDLRSRGVGRGQVRQITCEVDQDASDPSIFRVDGKDKSWFMQKGGIMFDRRDPASFCLGVRFLGDKANRFGDAYAELSRAEQHATANWLLMVGVAPLGYELTGHRDCKAGGFYFLLHLNYRRTAWRVIACPHEAELEDAHGRLYTCDPQARGQLELPAREGQTLGVEYTEGELWLMEGGARVARGHWVHTDVAAGQGRLPRGEYFPVILTPNCPTVLQAAVT